MFNVRPDAFWPWLYVKPPSDDPPGFRVAANGSVQDAGVDDAGSVLRGYGSGFSGPAPAEIGGEGAYRPNSDDNPFSFLDRRSPAIGPVPSFDGGSAPPHANSLRQMGEPWAGLGGYGGGLDAQSHTPLPGFRVKPPVDDPPGFRVVADGSVQGTRDGNPFGFLDRQNPSGGLPLYTLPSPRPSPIYPWTTAVPPLERELPGYLDNLDGSRDMPLATGDTGLHTDDDAAVWRVLSDTFGPRSSEYNRRDEKLPLTSEPTRQIEGENRLSPDLYDPTYLGTSPRNPLQEAFNQLSRIYIGVGLDPLNHFDGQHLGTRPTMLRGDDMSPAIGDAFDPQYVVPAQSPGGPIRPPPGHNNPPRSPAPLDPRPGTVAPLPQRPTTEQPAPSPAGPAAAAEAALRKREEAYKTHREQLQQLDPDHPLLKVEPEAGVVPDQATVDRYGDEVRGIVRRKIDRTIEGLNARSTYEQRSIVRTIGGNVDLRAEFERLKAGGKRIQGGGAGQYSRSDGELYELPGRVRIGFRMANDTRTGEKRSIPTLEIKYPGRMPIRFHYNNQR